jgi:CO/xanthine dehydrogenase Mo-binding subunit
MKRRSLLENVTSLLNRKGFQSFDPESMPPAVLAATEAASVSSRRNFLKGTGVMMVGFAASTALPKANAQSPIAPLGTVDATQVDSWLAVGADGHVTVFTGKVELGQGVRTITYQLVSEELYVPMSAITVITGITGICPDQGTTSGSQSTITQMSAGGLRQALDTARDALLLLASEELDAPVANLVIKNGVISVVGNPSLSMAYGDLIFGRRFNLTMNPNAVPKDPSKWTVLGTAVRRVDIPAKACGSFAYVQNIRVPGMLHGKVVRPTTIGAHFVSMDKSSLAGLPGNPVAVQIKDFVGVVADTEWHAINAAAALNVTWSTGDTLPPQASLYTYIQTLPSADSYAVNSGDVPQMLASAKQVFKAQYLHPYQMHGSIGSSCAVADVRGSGKTGSIKIWTSTQGPYPQRDSVSTLLGIPNSNAQVFYVDGSGCYGLNGADNVCYDAALLSQAVQAPVRVQYSRRDEMAGTGENYGAAYTINITAGVNGSNQILAWDYEAWTVTKGNRPSAAAPNNLPTGVLAGFAAAPTAVPNTTPTAPPATFGNGSNIVSNYVTGLGGNGTTGGTGTVTSQRCLTHSVASPFFTGPLRSPARLQNTFANECFMDEMAAGLKLDPVQFRRNHISDPRLMAALDSAVFSANWDPRSSPKGNPKTGVVTGRGVSCVLYEGNNGYCGMVAFVTVDQATGIITVNSLVSSQDSGPVLNPNGMRNQMEGGALQGLSRALFETVSWNNRAGIVTSTDWISYPVFQFGNPLPTITSVLINNPNQPAKGSGECTITLVGSAISNAVFDATGVRLRQIPFTPANFLAAKAAQISGS